jgi:hypothetical protein
MVLSYYLEIKMNSYDRHQLTVRELELENQPSSGELLLLAVALLVGLLSCLAFFFSL